MKNINIHIFINKLRNRISKSISNEHYTYFTNNSSRGDSDNSISNSKTEWERARRNTTQKLHSGSSSGNSTNNNNNNNIINERYYTWKNRHRFSIRLHSSSFASVNENQTKRNTFVEYMVYTATAAPTKIAIIIIATRKKERQKKKQKY